MNCRGDFCFFVPHPYPEETISSVIDRIGEVYSLDRLGVLGVFAASLDRELVNPKGLDWDNPNETLLRRLEDSIGAPPGSMDANRIVDGERWITYGRRKSYCPACIAEDRKAERGPYFRRRWAEVSVTMCDIHGVPLFEWERYRTWDGRKLRNRSAVPLSYPTDLHIVFDALWPGHVVARALMGFEAELGSLIETHGDITDTESREVGKLGKAIVSAAITGHYLRGKSTAGLMVPTYDGWELKVHLAWHSRSPGPATWQDLRNISDPGERRAAFLLVAAERDRRFPTDSVKALVMGSSPFAVRAQKAIWSKSLRSEAC